MAAVSNFVSVLAFYALFGTSFAAKECTSATYGVKTANRRPLTRTHFYPGTKLQEINMHSGCQDVGVLVRACDEVAPSVFVKNTSEALIDRRGSLNYLGYVDVVAYCASTNAPLDVCPKQQSPEASGSHEE